MQIITNQFQKEVKQHGSDTFPFLVSYEKLSKYESGSFLWHWHPEIEITWITKGQILYRVNHEVFHLKEGDILFGNANVLHSGYMEEDKDCEYISITFDPKMVYGFHKSQICQKYVEPVIQDFSLPAVYCDFSQSWHTDFSEGIQKLISLEKEKPDFYELDIVVELQKLWKILFRNVSLSERDTAHEKKDYERIKKILGFLEENYMNKIQLEDIADHIHLCTSECSRLFKRYMKVSLFTFLNEYRIERSLEYLTESEYNITDIAARTGFSDSNYYSKVFAKVKGCSPKEYRKERIMNLDR